MTDPSGPPRSVGRQEAPSRNARRGFLLGGLGVVTLCTVGAWGWFNVSADISGSDLSVTDALRAAQAGEITLVDIRRPDEWDATGIGQGAVPIDMRRTDFIQALLAQTGGDATTPVALICARGVRSARLSAKLQAAGFTRIIDVPEGMLGSGAGPGWLNSGLPVVRP